MQSLKKKKRCLKFAMVILDIRKQENVYVFFKISFWTGI